MTEVPTAPILLLEDERATASLISQLLAAERITNPVELVDTGAAALQYLGRVVGGQARRFRTCPGSMCCATFARRQRSRA
jgi:hypothetical protein